jgi:hypothetical protein
MAEQGAPNDTNKKGHFETNAVEGRGPTLASVSPATAAATFEGELLAEDAVTNAVVGSRSAAGGRYGGSAPGAEDGPHMIPAYPGRRSGPPITDHMHTDTSLMREVERAAYERRSFAARARSRSTSSSASYAAEDPHLGPRGDPAEGKRDD